VVGKPVGPWRKVDEEADEPPPPLGPYEDSPHLFRYALLYRAVARASGGTIGPNVVDTWEPWQTAAYLGVGLPADEADNESGATAGMSPEEIVKEKNEYFAKLQQAQRDGTPPPEPPPSIRAVQRPVGEAGVAVMEPLMEVDEAR
jgi:hypothetical protein